MEKIALDSEAANQIFSGCYSNEKSVLLYCLSSLFEKCYVT